MSEAPIVGTRPTGASVALLSMLPLVRPSATQRVQTGDLLFVHEPCGGGIGAAIEQTGQATVRWMHSHGAPEATQETASHVALAWRRAADDELFLVEALEPKVRLTSAHDFFTRSGANAVFYLATFVDQQMRQARGHAANIALAQVGKPYADEFQPPPASFYCSSLIEYAFGQALGGEAHPFNPEPFVLIFEPESFWREYYAKLHRTVPTNITGSNPTLLLHSRALSFQIYQVDAITGTFGAPRISGSGRFSLGSEGDSYDETDLY